MTETQAQQATAPERPDRGDLVLVAGNRCSCCQSMAGYVGGVCCICGEPPLVDPNDLEDDAEDA